MAMISHRLRRALLTATSSFNRSFPLSPTSLSPSPTNSSSVSSLLQRSVLARSSEVSRASSRLFSTRQYKLYKEGDEITDDTVLFEGCDFNHWLITMDFRKDNTLTPEQMVATYEETCAKGLGISLEEAKKKIYACSTTTYQGFQAIMTEQESEKFKDLPGVVFVLPDSYIDPVNKEYGGDKYEEGVITHRPPPIQNNRSRTRENRGNPRFDRQGGGGGGNFQRNPQFGQQPPMQGGGGSYGPPGQGAQAPPQFQGGYNQGSRSPPPPYQGGYNQSSGSPPPPYQGGYNQGSVSTPPQSQGGYKQGPVSPPPPSQVGYNQGSASTQPPSQGGYNQGPGSSPPPYQAGYNQNQRPPVLPNQGTPGGYGQGGPSNYNQAPQGGYNQGGPRNYGPPQGNGNFGPASGAGNPGFGQGYFGPGQQQNQTFPQADQRNREWNNDNPAGLPGSDQGRRY